MLGLFYVINISYRHVLRTTTTGAQDWFNYWLARIWVLVKPEWTFKSNVDI